MSSLHRVRVFGRDVQVRSTASEEEVRKVESYVNEMIDSLQSSMKTSDFQILSIMALLNIAESFLLKSQECSRLETVMRDRVSRMTQHIDEVVLHD